ncbi:FxLYD domain-containing protein [Candidatus Saccharibacteria bacterium]|nr:FxLYD domain-containing protein [Candidatus Saccharibacteria bacterium]
MDTEEKKVNKKEKRKILDVFLTVGVTIVLCVTVVATFLTFIQVQKLSRNMDIVKNNVWIEKTNSYDNGSSSFFDHKVEAVKKDSKDGNYIKGELINRSGQRITEATVYFKLYDKDGNLVDWSSDSIKTWDSGEKWIYNAYFPEGSTKYEFAEFDIAY